VTEGAVASLRAAGASVTHRKYSGEDHFLFLSRRDDVLSDVAAFVGTAGEGAWPEESGTSTVPPPAPAR